GFAYELQAVGEGVLVEGHSASLLCPRGPRRRTRIRRLRLYLQGCDQVEVHHVRRIVGSINDNDSSARRLGHEIAVWYVKCLPVGQVNRKRRKGVRIAHCPYL